MGSVMHWNRSHGSYSSVIVLWMLVIVIGTVDIEARGDTSRWSISNRKLNSVDGFNAGKRLNSYGGRRAAVSDGEKEREDNSNYVSADEGNDKNVQDLENAFGNITWKDVDASWKAYSQYNNTRGQQRERVTPLSWVVSRYLDNEELHVHMLDFVNRCGDISRIVQIGSSVEGRPIEALEISNTLSQNLSDGKAHVKMIGGIHGDEVVGRIISMGMAEWICENYKKDDLAKSIVRKLHLWILPSMNPDGFEIKSRHNSNGKDLNRDFPDRFDQGGMSSSMEGRQPETKSVMNWSMKYPFVSSLVFHGGALVVSYPFDGTADGSSRYAATADDLTFRYLAREYAKSHGLLNVYRQRRFPGGITNGADWYSIYGSMGDWNYLEREGFELTVEVSNEKWPSEDEFPGYFDQNKDAMLAFIKASALQGFTGKVFTKDKNGKKIPVQDAKISIKGIDSSVTTRSGGRFNRPLFPGSYTAVIEKPGYSTVIQNIKIPKQGNRSIAMNIELQPK